MTAALGSIRSPRDIHPSMNVRPAPLLTLCGLGLLGLACRGEAQRLGGREADDGDGTLPGGLGGQHQPATGAPGGDQEHGGGSPEFSGGSSPEFGGGSSPEFGGGRGAGAEATGGRPSGTDADSGGSAGTVGADGSGGEGGSGSDRIPCGALTCEHGAPCVEVLGERVCDCPAGTFGAECQISSVAITASGTATCLLLDDGTARCWGAASSGYHGYTVDAEPLAGDLTSIEFLVGMACGVSSDQTLQCNACDVLQETTERVTDVAFVWGNEGDMGCVLREDGTVSCDLCFGGELSAPSGVFTEIASYGGPCGLREDGIIICWDPLDRGENEPWAPTGTFQALGSGDYPCGVRHDGSLAWYDNGVDASALAAGTYTAVTADSSSVCALRQDGSVACAGSTADGPPPGEFVALNAHLGQRCGVRAEGTLACWGAQALPPFGVYGAITATNSQICALRPEGEVRCWGGGETSVTSGRFVAMDAAAGHVCALAVDGTITCWDVTGWLDALTPPEGVFSGLSCGALHCCGLRDDGTADCWGDDSVGQATPPSGPFTSLAAGFNRTCGIAADGQASCWGGDAAEASPPADAVFSQLAVSAVGTCGLVSDGTIRCWGSTGIESVPEGTFTSLALGRYGKGCAVRSDQTLVCWGAGVGDPLMNPPPGQFVAVTIGDPESTYMGPSPFGCGLRADRTLACWGDLGL